MQSSSSLLLTSAVTLLGAAAHAQSRPYVVVPAGVEHRDGSTSSPYFSGYGAGRLQQVFDGAAVCQNVAVVQSVQLRCDEGRGAPAVPARRFAQVKLSLGNTSVTPGSISPTFASNRTGTQTVVFSGAFNLPAQSAGSRSFNIVFPTTAPFIYQRTNGNLLLEFEVPGTATKANYFFDAHVRAPAGEALQFGVAGRLTGNVEPALAASNPMPGSQLTVKTAGTRQSTTGFLFWGGSNTNSNGIALPFSLSGIGAPGNFLHVSPDVTVPLALTGGSGALSVNLPNNPWLSGQTLYVQGGILDSVNALGIVTTSGIALTIGGGTSPVQSVGTFDSTRPTGSISRTQIGLVFKFAGTIN